MGFTLSRKQFQTFYVKQIIAKCTGLKYKIMISLLDFKFFDVAAYYLFNKISMEFSSLRLLLEVLLLSFFSSTHSQHIHTHISSTLNNSDDCFLKIKKQNILPKIYKNKNLAHKIL